MLGEILSKRKQVLVGAASRGGHLMFQCDPAQRCQLGKVQVVLALVISAKGPAVTSGLYPCLGFLASLHQEDVPAEAGDSRNGQASCIFSQLHLSDLSCCLA